MSKLTRIQKLRDKMSELSIQAFLITSQYNLRYLTGFTGTTGLAIVTQNNAFFVTDSRYMQQAAQQCVGYEIVQNFVPIFEVVASLIEDNHIEEVAFEETHVSYASYELFSDIFDCDLIPVAGVIEGLREIKDAEEITITREACRIADKAFEHICTFIKPGVTEIQVANELDFHMRSLGATSISFETIVASGYRSAMPHGVATDKIIESGELVTMDFGCYYNGYVSDMTRTIAVGKVDSKLKEIYQIVLEAQLKVIAAAGPTISGKGLDDVARNHIESYGFGDNFGHSTGHGIGLEIHEGPSVAKLNTINFVPNNIITDEPGIYLPNLGGVRIEDDLLITETGNEVLTRAPKELIVL